MNVKGILPVVAVGAVCLIGAQVAIAAARSRRFPRFWRELAQAERVTDAMTLVALGDSAAVGVGASHPLNGFVGLVAAFVEGRTGRPVRIVNLAVGGATAGDVVANQLPRAEFEDADLVIYSSANDLERRVPIPEYRNDLEVLLGRLPAELTVLSDLPLEPGRARYQAVLSEVADRHEIRRADFAAAFTGAGRRLDVFSWLPPHLNDRGYRIWAGSFLGPVAQILRAAPLLRPRRPHPPSE